MADQDNNRMDGSTDPGGGREQKYEQGLGHKQHEQELDRPAHRLKRAIRLLPANQRARYAGEWQADLAAAKGARERAQVARAAMAMARRVRLREFGATLLGGRGAWRAVGWWIGGLLVFVLLWPLFPIIFVPLLLLLMIFALVYTGTPSRGSHWLMVGSGITCTLAVIFSCWSFVTQLNAAEAGGDKSYLAPWTLGAFYVIAGSVCLFILGGFLAFRREKSLRT